jgi:hypothetical protein
MSCGRRQERAPACRWQAEPRSLAGASFEVSRRPVHSDPKLRNSAEAPELGLVAQYCIRPSARGRGLFASSRHTCGSFGHKFGATAPTHFGMPLHRCQTVGSPVAPPEAPKPKTHLPLRRAPGLHSCLGWNGRIGGWPMHCGRRCARGALAGYSSDTPGGIQAEFGHRRRRWCVCVGNRSSDQPPRVRP